jgi:single-strand DNA-binding protein
MSAHITITGNLVADPEITFSKQGKAIAKFRVAATRRVRNTEGVWHDAETTFWRCTAFANLAEHIADALHKGDAVIVTGRAYSNAWTTQDGEKRERIEITAEHVGQDLKVHMGTRQAASQPPPEPDPWDTTSAPIPF